MVADNHAQPSIVSLKRDLRYYKDLAEKACSCLREIGEIRLDSDGGEYYWVASGEYLVKD